MTLSAGRIAWYVNRLRAMDAHEIAHRVIEAAKRRAAKHRSYSWQSFEAQGPLPALPVDPQRLRALGPEILERWRAIAPSPQHAGAYHALNQTFPISLALDWHRDPETGLRWPDADYCFDIPYRHDKTRGDIKLVWEINRLQFLPPLAAGAVLDGDAARAELALALIESWIDANPPFKGVNWSSGIELALRIVSILLVLGLIGTDKVDQRRAAKITACLAAHAYWLARYPSRHSSANNHLIAEAAGLYVLGTLAPHFVAASITAHARQTLIDEAFRQIHDDGVGAEQSPTYTAFTCEWYLLAFAVAERAGAPFPGKVVARIGDAGEHLRWILDGEGHHPRIGDDDEGRVIGSGRGHEPHYVASIVNAVAAATGRPGIAVEMVSPQLRNLLLGWPDAAGRAPAGRRVFESGGYTVLRRALSGHACLIVLDHGPLGYLSIAAHGHADALALMLHVDGKPVLVDAGTYLYHAGGVHRDRLRGTAAHNTLCLNGADQSEIAGAFNWRRKANAKLLKADATEGTDWIVAEHDGYVRDFGFVHRRAMSVDDAGITLQDSLVAVEGGGSQPLHGIVAGFLLHPECEARIAAGVVHVTRGGRPVLELSGSDNLEAVLAEADYSPAFGVLLPTVRIAFEAVVPSERTFSVRIAVPLDAPVPIRHGGAHPLGAPSTSEGRA